MKQSVSKVGRFKVRFNDFNYWSLEGIQKRLGFVKKNPQLRVFTVIARPSKMDDLFVVRFQDFSF